MKKSHVHKKVLFLLKFRQDSSGKIAKFNGVPLSSGLYNSAKFVVNMLKNFNVDVDIESVVDANDIDRMVTKYHPTDVIIEALWVPPAKFGELIKRHPNVKWIVRIHSELPFLANEGMAITWLWEYLKYPNVSLAANSSDTTRDLRTLAIAKNPHWTISDDDHRILFLPNYYDFDLNTPHNIRPFGPNVNIGCFGAIRPMKNQLIQAVAAITWAEWTDKNLMFHINVDRLEQNGEAVLKNLRATFVGTRHKLVEHAWLDHDKFMTLLKQMHMGMQVSLSETFNIVAADMVASGIPIVVSDQIEWSSQRSQAKATKMADILRVLLNNSVPEWAEETLVLNRLGLHNSNEVAITQWLKHFK
jgi:hypothetical protein